MTGRTGKDHPIAQVCPSFAITDQIYSRSHNKYGGFTIDGAPHLKEPEHDYSQWKRSLAKLSIDKLIMKESTGGLS